MLAPSTLDFHDVDKGGGWEAKKLVKLLVAGFILQFLSHCKNGVGIGRTLVVTEDHFALAALIHSALPAVLTEIIANAV